MRLQEFLHGATSHRPEPEDTTGQVIGITPARGNTRQPIRFAPADRPVQRSRNPEAPPARERTHVS